MARWRLFKRLGLGHGLGLNLGKSGIGASLRLPGAPASVGISTTGNPYVSAGVPGTGLYVRHDLTRNRANIDKPNHTQHTGPQVEGQKVYFIQDGEAVKIGISNDPEARLGELQIGNYRTLTLLATAPGGRRFEDWLQNTFDHLHIRGEWYALSPQLMAAIRKYGQLMETNKK